MKQNKLEDDNRDRCLMALSEAFSLAVDGLIESRMTGNVEEELTTGALVGSMASHAYWVNALEDRLSAPPFVWTHYRKSGQDAASEPWTGADFALILRVGPGEFRAAAFQAKRAGVKEGSFTALQLAPAREPHPSEPQIVRLARYGRSARTESNASPSLHWVHYLGYQRHAIFHVPLSEMSSYIEKLEIRNNFILGERHEKGDQSDDLIEKTWNLGEIEKTYVPAAPLKPFTELIAKGCSGSLREPVEGWLSISGENAAVAFIKATAPLMSVFEGAPSQSYQPIMRGAEYMALKDPEKTVASQIRGYLKS